MTRPVGTWNRSITSVEHLRETAAMLRWRPAVDWAISVGLIPPGDASATASAAAAVEIAAPIARPEYFSTAALTWSVVVDYITEDEANVRGMVPLLRIADLISDCQTLPSVSISWHRLLIQLESLLGDNPLTISTRSLDCIRVAAKIYSRSTQALTELRLARADGDDEFAQARGTLIDDRLKLVTFASHLNHCLSREERRIFVEWVAAITGVAEDELGFAAPLHSQ